MESWPGTSVPIGWKARRPRSQKRPCGWSGEHQQFLSWGWWRVWDLGGDLGTVVGRGGLEAWGRAGDEVHRVPGSGLRIDTHGIISGLEIQAGLGFGVQAGFGLGLKCSLGMGLSSSLRIPKA